MAVRTYAQLISDISTYLTAKVRITSHSALETNIVDTLFNLGNGSGARPYKVYTALLSQAGTSAPVATVLENTLGGTVVWSYSSVGTYVATGIGLFTSGKTVLITTDSFPTIAPQIGHIYLYALSTNSFTLYANDISGGSPGTPSNDILGDTPIRIEVYP